MKLASYHTSAQALFLLGALSLSACGDDHGPSSCKEPAEGCSCNGVKDQGICLDGVALVCTDGKWEEVEDGPCFPEGGPEPSPPERCYSPFQNVDQAYVDGFEGCACANTPSNQAGYCIEGTALYCDEGKWQAAEDGACTPSVPITIEECTEAGGKRSTNYDKSTGGCAAPLAWLNALTDGTQHIGACCIPVLLTPEECATLGGEALGDPGDGSLNRAGCPDSRKQLGTIEYIEGGLCCAP
jgi:hypothetical protein